MAIEREKLIQKLKKIAEDHPPHNQFLVDYEAQADHILANYDPKPIFPDIGKKSEPAVLGDGKEDRAAFIERFRALVFELFGGLIKAADDNDRLELTEDQLNEREAEAINKFGEDIYAWHASQATAAQERAENSIRIDELEKVSSHLSFTEDDKFKDPDVYSWIWQERVEELNGGRE